MMMDPIKLFRGDDTNWNNGNFLNFIVTSQTVDLSTMTARFIVGNIVFDNISLSSGSFTINFSHQQTLSLPKGINNATLQILDSEGRIKTATNSISLLLTNKVFEEQERTIEIDVPGESEIDISITVNGNGGTGDVYWGNIIGDIQNQTDLQEEFATKQDIIEDLETIRNGAELGSTAVQPAELNNYATTQELSQELSTKQDVISDLETIRSGAALGATALQQSNVTSTYSSTGTAPINGTGVASAISPINEVIPAQASSSNQLADKNFVNSSISTNTANFIGTFESVEDLEAYTGEVTNNDYAFVISIDSDENTVYNRYKYNSETQEWLFEYSLNNSSFTANQWAAINSGITSSLVTQIGTNTNNIAAKQPKTLETPLTIDGTSQTTVEGALGGLNTLASKGLANKATGTNSLTILGTASTATKTINIGADALMPFNNYSTSIGADSSASGYGGVALGQYAQASGHGAIAIGHGASVFGGTGVTRGSIAIGGDGSNNSAPNSSEIAKVDGVQYAIQLGKGTNSTANTLQVFEHQLLDGNTGKIPTARLDTEYLAGISRCSYNFQQLAVVNGGEYTAPANGFFVLNGVLANAANNRLYLLLRNKPYAYGNRLAHMAFGALSSYRQYVWLPVAKGESVAITAQSTATNPDFDLRFYYAIGEQIPTPEYTPVQYIQGQYNAQYIKSGIIPTSAMKVYCKLQNTSSTLGFGWGCRNETYDGAQMSVNATNQNVVVDWFGAAAEDRWTLSTSVATTDIFELTIENNVAEIKKNGSVVGTHTFTPTATITRELLLTGFNNNGTIGGAGATGRLYEYKLWSPEGDLLLDMKPAKDADGIACLYNSVNKILYYNQGTGSYTAGPDAN